MIAVAIDDDVDAIQAAAGGIGYPVLIDAAHVVTELYAISNVPTVLLIDEHDRIVQPNWNAFSNDMFREITGIDSAPSGIAPSFQCNGGRYPVFSTNSCYSALVTG